MSSEAYDLFISYKSQDANTVRAVAERLSAGGVRVWCAEYQVLLSNYDNFLSAIDRGVDASRYAVLFTSEEWLVSEHCRHEASRVLRRMPLDRVLEVCMEPEYVGRFHLFPQLRDTVSMAWTGKVYDVLEFIRTHTNLAVSHELNSIRQDVFDELMAPHAQPTRLRFDATLNTGNVFKERHSGVIEAMLETRGNRVPSFSHFLEGRIDDHAVELQVDINPCFTRVGNTRLPPVESAAGRDVYDTYRAHDHEELLRRGLRERGLHVYFDGDGRSHLALTYLGDGDDDNQQAWYRRFSMVVTNSDRTLVGQVDLTFKVVLPKDDFPTFCKLTQTFESIASSLRCDPQAGLARESRTLIAVKGLICLVAVFFGWLINVPDAQAMFNNPLFALGFGVLVGDFLLTAIVREARRINVIFGVGFNDRFYVKEAMNNPGAARIALAAASIGQVVAWLVCCVFWGLLNPILLSACLLARWFDVTSPAYWSALGVLVVSAGSWTQRRRLTRAYGDTDRARWWAPGTPTFAMDGSLSVISPDLVPLVLRMRGEDRRFVDHIIHLVLAAIAFAGLLLVTGHQGAAIWLAASLGLAAVAWYVFHLARNFVMETLEPMARHLTDDDESESAARIGEGYLNALSKKHRLGLASRALQWKAKACQAAPAETRHYERLADAAMWLSKVLEIQRRPSLRQCAGLARQVAEDAEYLAFNHPNSPRIVQHRFYRNIPESLA